MSRVRKRLQRNESEPIVLLLDRFDAGVVAWAGFGDVGNRLPGQPNPAALYLAEFLHDLPDVLGKGGRTYRRVEFHLQMGFQAHGPAVDDDVACNLGMSVCFAISRHTLEVRRVS